MVFARSSVLFAVYSTVFVAASSLATICILPLVLISFVSSALVMVLNGVSYTSFKVASAKYNRLVLFLNRLLRHLADSIPPSVGIVEVGVERTILKESVRSLLEKIKPTKKKEEENFLVLDGNGPVVVDDEPLQLITVASDPDTVKDGSTDI